MSFSSIKTFQLYACLGILLGSTVWASGQESSVINVWYGNEQTFGKPGTVQRWVNILGNVDPSKNIVKLNYSLNDGEFRFLNIGPDRRRLQRPGDFNVEIPIEDLLPDKNTVLIEAVDQNGDLYREMIALIWAPEKTTPEFSINWSEVQDLTDIAQPIDGFWRIEGDQLVSAPEAVGYDRVLGFGDMEWTDFEVSFPFRVLKTDPSSFETEESVGPGLLFTLRWQGHSDAPVACSQPHCGWEPFGGLIGYGIDENDIGKGSIMTKWPDDYVDATDHVIQPGIQYWLRARAETTAAGSFYSYKIWPGTQRDEPESWSAQALGGPLNLNKGSFLVVAHHVDLAIGQMNFIPLANIRNQIVDLLTNYTDVLIQLPYLVIWGIGILWALAIIRQDPDRGRWLLASFVLLFVTSLLGFLLLHYLPEYLQNRGWITRRLTYIYVLINLIPIGGHVIAWAILFKTLWPGKKTTTS